MFRNFFQSMRFDTSPSSDAAVAAPDIPTDQSPAAAAALVSLQSGTSGGFAPESPDHIFNLIKQEITTTPAEAAVAPINLETKASASSVGFQQPPQIYSQQQQQQPPLQQQHAEQQQKPGPTSYTGPDSSSTYLNQQSANSSSSNGNSTAAPIVPNLAQQQPQQHQSISSNFNLPDFSDV